MNFVRKPLIGVRLAFLLACWLGLYRLAAFLPPAQPGLPNFDKRTEAPVRAAPPEANQIAAEGRLKVRLAGVKVDLDEITQTPKWIAVPTGTLSGPDGRGQGISLQTAMALPPNEPYRAVKGFLNEHAALFGHNASALDTAKVKRDFVSSHNGLRTVVWQQQIDNVPVFEGLLVGHTTRRGELVNISSRFLPDAEQAANRVAPNRAALLAAPRVSAEQAIVNAAQNLGDPLTIEQIAPLAAKPEQEAAVRRYTAPVLSGETQTRLVWLPMDRSKIRLCWEVLLTSRGRGELFRVLIDAETGEAQLRHCLTHYISEATYRVFTSDSPSPFSPGHPTPLTSQPPLVPRTLVVTNAVNTNASPNGWIDDGVNETRGNNVDAHLDRNADDAPDLPRPQGSPSRVFDFPMDLGQAPTTYGSAATVQLFYWCNWMHDKLYELGFTEAAGNFQVNNFGRGGLGNDAVQADAQDGSGLNNANFSTPPDGSPGRMQMYVFDGPNPDRDGDLDAEVVLHEYAHGLSNRRVGGGVGISALQSAGMGEGWSDFYGLALLSESGDNLDGNYAAGGYLTYELTPGFRQNYYYGIRRYPYSTDMLKNPLTFKDIDPSQASSHPGIPTSPIFGGGGAAEVHNQGEVWCVTLWEARANLIHKHGFAVGNQLILQLVTDGMNLSPANPNFLQARDAIIQADQINNGGANHNELWAAFSKRGMGFSATSPSSSTTDGVAEAFDLPDDLRIVPVTVFVASGEVGGPFSPSEQSYALTNIGTNTLVWVVTKSATWLNLSGVGGTLPPGGSTALNVSLDASAASLPMGIYTDTARFTNVTSGVGQTRQFILRIGQPDTFTEIFHVGDNDLDFQTFTFTPNGSPSFYAVCRETATNFFTNPAGGTSLVLGDDQFASVTLSGGSTVSLYGRRTNLFFVGSNGYLTFNEGDSEYVEDPFAHFRLPRVAALFDDLNPAEGGTISWRQLSNRVAVTYLDLPEYGSINSNRFQIEMFFDGAIRLTYLRVDAQDGLVGLSQGTGVPPAFTETDFSAIRSCVPPIEVALPAGATEGDGVLADQGRLNLAFPVATNITVSLTSSDTTELSVPTTVPIPAGQTNASFSLTIMDDAVLDGSQGVTVTAAALGFPDGSAMMRIHDNETAALQVQLPANATEGVLPVQGVVTVSQPPASPVSVSLSSSDTTELQVPSFAAIPAGQTSGVFFVTIVNDTEIDGPRNAIVTAHVQNWTDGSASLTVLDNETTTLTLSLPPIASENEGVLGNAGSVSLDGTLTTNLLVNLASSDTTELTVPSSVTIPAGQLSAPFNLTLVDDPLVDGIQVVMVTAMSSGFMTGSASLQVLDDESPPLPRDPSPPHLATNVPTSADLSWRSGAEAELILNGGFETGDLTGWTRVPSATGDFEINDGALDPPSPDGPLPPFAGSFCALSIQEGPGPHGMYQQVRIPANASSAMLHWAHRVRNHAGAFSVNQQYRVEIRSTNDATLAVAFSTDPRDPLLDDWVQRSFDVSGFAGQTVRVFFYVNPGDFHLGIHLDNVSLLAARAEASITNDVYFGTNPAPGPAEFLGSTTNTTWALPTLTPLTTYYWQVVARRVGMTPGPIWQFTTRGVDHFDWSVVPSPQVVGGPFSVSLTAKDENNITVSNFTGTATLDGFVGVANASVFSDDFEDGDFAGWAIGAGTFVRAVTNDTAAGGVNSFTMIGGSQDHFRGISHSLSNITPDAVQFYVRAISTIQAGGYVVLGTAPDISSTAVFFYMRDDGLMGIHEDVGGFHSAPYVANRWYKITLSFDWTSRAVDYYVDDTLVGAGIPFRGAAVGNLTQVYLYNFHNTRNWWDEIQFIQGGLTVPLAIMPTNSGNFVNGGWTGNLTVLEPATNATLRARDAGGHQGISNPFDVLVQHDLAVSVIDSPDPLAVGGSLTNIITVVNSGPSAATGVTLTNVLPAGLTFGSAVSSQGSCSHAAGIVTCNLGSLAGGAAATVTVVGTATVAGQLTNRITIARAEPDGYPGNNSVVSVTTVQVPALRINSVAVLEGNSGTSSAVFLVQISPAPALTAMVRYASANNTAQAGSDYLATNGSLSFPAGSTNAQPISVTIRGDTTGEPVDTTETFFVDLSSPSNAVVATARGIGTIINDDVPPAAYVRSRIGPPWGSFDNEAALDRVFGTGNWQPLRYETLNPLALFSPATTFIFMEGSDNNALVMESFLDAHRTEMENWVASGGSLFLNAAPNEGDGMNLGFGVNLIYSDFTDIGRAADLAHPIFNGPFTPVGTAWNAGYFGHATVTGSNLMALVTNSINGRFVLAEKKVAAGCVLFGGMTLHGFHSPQAEAANLRANIIAHGSSNCIPLLHLVLPSSATEGDGLLTGQGKAELLLPRGTNLTVTLVSADTTELTVPPSVVIPAGQTNASFDITIVDDAVLDGSQQATVNASASGFRSGGANLTVHDNESAILQVRLPGSAAEGGLPVQGVVTVSQPPASLVSVSLSSSDTTELQVPSFVAIPAGQTSGVFSVTIVNDTEIDGPRNATVTAHVQNWTDGIASMIVLDDESTALTVSLPPNASENDGVLVNAASVRLDGTLTTNLVVNLASSDTTELTVPPSVTIPAGQLSALFSLTPVDDPLVDGIQVVMVTAMSSGFTTGSASLQVLDDESPPLPRDPSPPHLATNVPTSADLSWRTGAETELISNGGFETGTLAGWTEENTGGGNYVINDGTFLPSSGDGPFPPFAGGFSVVTDQTGPGLHTLYQDVALPAGGGPLLLRWADRIRNHGGAFAANQYYRAEIRNPAGGVLAVAYSTQPGDPLLNDWVERSFNLAPYRGQTVRIAFLEEDNLGFFNLHLDNISIQTSGGAPITNDVYFGTNPVPGLAEFLGSTTSPNWTLPALAPLTTYYWQVVARRVGMTPGPIWQFTTRGVDHFDWSVVPSPQVVGGPFSVSLTAKDENNITVSNFAGTVSLSASVGIPVDTVQVLTFTGFADTATGGEYENTLTAISNHFTNFVESNITSTNASALQAALADKQVFLVVEQEINGSLETMGALGSAWAAVLNDFVHRGGVVVVCSFQASEHLMLANSGLLPLTSLSSPSSTLVITNGGPHVLTEGLVTPFNAEYLHTYASTTGTVSLVTVGDSQPVVISRDLGAGHVVMIGTDYYTIGTGMDRIIANAVRWASSTSTPLAITPTNSGNFVNGGWTGNLTVLEPATNATLSARDNNGHQGLSNPFDVLVQNDLAVSVVDSPDPVAVGANLTNLITVVNSGPSAATGVTLTNVLPAGLTFGSAVSSQGSCSHTAGIVTCNLGSLAGGAAATVTVAGTATVAGQLTNRVTIARAEPDGYPGNNSVVSVTTVQVPALRINSVAVLEGNSGTSSAVFLVQISPAPALTAMVRYASANNTAQAGSDYLATNGSLIFPAGSTNAQPISATILGDMTGEPTETFFVDLSNPSNAVVATARGIGTIINDDVPPVAYVRSSIGLPWGSADNESAMDRVFGAGNWQDLRYETLNPLALFSPATTFIFMEGSDNNALAMESFLGAHRTEMENWVAASGSLFLNAAPNEGDGMNLGFGVNLIYPDFTDSGRAAVPAHPIFNGPFTPVGSVWTGSSFGHATVTGSDLVTLITNSVNGRVVLAEKKVGGGCVLFGGMTLHGFHSPQVEASNLRANIIAHASSNCLLPLSINDVVVTEGNAGTTNAVFTVRLSAASPLPVTVHFSTTNGTATAPSDYVSTNGMVTFSPGQTNKTISVPVKGDTTNEATEIFQVVLDSPVNASITDGHGTASIVNDDPPVLDVIPDQTIYEGTLLTFTASAADAGQGSLVRITDFEGFPNGTANGSVLFRDPRLSGSTRLFLDLSPDLSSVTDSFPVGQSGARALQVSWSFNSTPNPWVRLFTFNPANLPNPVVPLNQVILFDIYTDRALWVGLGLREITNAIGPPVGSNGGTVGAIEWAGITNTVGTQPSPVRLVPANNWVTLAFDLSREPIRNFAGGNGILSSPSGLGVLEHLALVPADGIGTYNLYLDNFSVFYTNPPLSFSLAGNAPAGASIDPVSGVFTWIPTEAQGPTTNVISVRATSLGPPSLSTTQTFTVIVLESNRPPTLAEISPQTVTEGGLLTFNAVATDPDLPTNSLTYSLEGDVPDGASLDPANGMFNWRPMEDQGPGVYTLSLRVRDNGSPNLSATRTFNVIVMETNNAPTLAPIQDQFVLERTPLSFTNTAADTDLPVNTLMFSLDGTPPLGASVDPVTGVFHWIPAEDQGPGLYPFTVRVTDNGSPNLNATRSFTVTVAEDNRPPTFAVVDAQTVLEEDTLSFTVPVNDADVPANILSFALEPGFPDGASIDPVTGVFSWKPDEVQGPSLHNIVVRATDNGSPNLTSTLTFSVQVLESNRPPVLAPIADRMMSEGSTRSMTNSATDPDWPANALTFSLDAGAPAGATIDPVTGVFTWMPPAAAVGQTNSFTVRVTDDGVPPGSDAKTFNIKVVSEPIIESIEISGKHVIISWSAKPGTKYHVLYKKDLNAPHWKKLGGKVTATSDLATKKDHLHAREQRYYKIEVTH